jgi:hypothetical protein
MQITVNNDFTTGGPFTQAQIDSFVADETIAINILNATFTNNISLTFNVGFASINGTRMAPTDGGLGNVNFDAAVLLPYSQLRADLLTFGQPGFFNAANLPDGASINGMSNFWISPSAATAFGLPTPNAPPDGFIGINTTIAPGNIRIATILHEIGHAIGRHQGNIVSAEGVASVSALDLVRFISPANRLFDGSPNAPTPAYFSIDGGVKKVTDRAAPNSPSDFRSSSNLTPNDPFNDVVDAGGIELRKLTTADVQLMVALGFRVGATAVMVLQGSGGFYQSYSIGNNAVSASSQLGPVGTDWRFVTLGSFNDDIISSFTSDMLLRNSTSGDFQVYNISNNAITNSVSLGAVGLDWQFSGIGNFSVPAESDMLLRNSTNGDFQVYNISNNAITNSVSLGEVGFELAVLGYRQFRRYARRERYDPSQHEQRRALRLQHTQQSDHQLCLDGYGRPGLAVLGRRQFQQKPRRKRFDPSQHDHRRAPGLRRKQQSDHRLGLHRHGRRGLAVRGRCPNPSPRCRRFGIAQRQHRPISSLQHLRQSNHGNRRASLGGIGLAARGLCPDGLQRLHRQLGRSARLGPSGLNLSARAGNGRFRRRRGGSRWPEFRHRRRSVAATAVSDDAAARVRR